MRNVNGSSSTYGSSALSFGPQEGKITTIKIKGQTTSLFQWDRPLTVRFPSIESLSKSIDSLCDAPSSGSSELYDGSSWDQLIDWCKNGRTIIPDCIEDLMVPVSGASYPAIREFGVSNAYVGFSNTVLRSKFNNLGLMKVPKMIGPDDLTRVVTSRPMQDHKGPDCGMIRATGEYKVTENYDGQGHGLGLKAQYQKRSCHCSACEICGEKNILDDAWLYSQDIWARVQGLNICGMDAHVYEWVFSPPQGTQEQFRETVRTVSSKEGQTEYERTISFVIRQTCGDVQALCTGWSIVYHPERQNGKDGAHRSWDGNDMDPYHWRVSPHYHVIVVSRFKGPALIKRLNKVKKDNPWLQAWSIVIGPNKEDKRKARAQGKKYVPPHELKDREELEHKLAYVLSHAGIRQKVGEDGEAVGRRLPMISHYGLNHYKRMSRLTLKAGVPLLSQGYEETIEEDGQELPVYWANYYYECVARDRDVYYAHVEGVNSAHVYVFNFDKDGARRDITELVRSWRANASNMEEPERMLSAIYQYVRSDRRFIFDFVPVEGKPLRSPYRLFMKAGERDLWNLITDGLPPVHEIPAPDGLPSEVSDIPAERVGQGPTLPEASKRPSEAPEHWTDYIDDYVLLHGRGSA